MQNNLKKVGIVGACLVAMVGTGGCLTYMAVTAVKDGVSNASSRISSNIKDKKEFDSFLKAFNTLTAKVNEPNATAQDYLNYAHFINSNWVTTEPDNNKLLMKDKQQKYEYYLEKSANMGNKDAQREWFPVPLYRAIAMDAYGRIDSNGIDGLNFQSQRESLALDNFLQTQLIPLAKKDPQTFCEFYPFTNDMRLFDINSMKVGEANKIEFGFLRNQNKYLSATNVENVQLVLLSELIACPSHFDKLRGDSEKTLPDYMERTFRVPDYYPSKYENQEDILRNKETVSYAMREMAIYGAYAILTKDDKFMQILVEKMKKYNQSDYVGDFKQKSESLARIYKQANLPLNPIH